MGWGVAGSRKSGKQSPAELSYKAKHTKSQDMEHAGVNHRLLWVCAIKWLRKSLKPAQMWKQMKHNGLRFFCPLVVFELRRVGRAVGRARSDPGCWCRLESRNHTLLRASSD